jgi:hypothetical protein
MTFKRTHSSSRMAFPRTAEYACAFEAYSKTSYWWYIAIVCVCALGVVAIVKAHS